MENRGRVFSIVGDDENDIIGRMEVVLKNMKKPLDNC